MERSERLREIVDSIRKQRDHIKHGKVNGTYKGEDGKALMTRHIQEWLRLQWLYHETRSNLEGALMKEKPAGKRTVKNTGVHDETHEKHAWFATVENKPPRDKLDVVRHAMYQQYEAAIYTGPTFAWVGYLQYDPTGEKRIAAVCAAAKRGIELHMVPLPPVFCHDENEEDLESGWDPAWGENPKE